MMRPGKIVPLIVFAVLACTVTPANPPAFLPRDFSFALIGGGQEVPPILTPGIGRALFRLHDDRNEIEYALEWRGLRGEVQQAHIHFGQKGVNGGVLAFLCSNLSADATPCADGEARGVLGADDVLGISAQGVEPGDIRGLFRILRHGLGYVNVHSSAFPSGEIRGQIGGGLRLLTDGLLDPGQPLELGLDEAWEPTGGRRR